MFTGIVEALGSVAETEDRGDAVRLTVRGPEVLGDARPGDSIAVDGCCLTVAELRDDAFTADVMRQTLLLTTLGRRTAGDPVNLERAVTASTRLGGHLMSGHVDATATVLAREPSPHWELVRVSLPAALSRYVVPQGSVAVDGVSLTVVDVGADSFTVSLIPETLARTTLGTRQPGDRVNLETDVIARHVEKLITAYLPGARS